VRNIGQGRLLFGDVANCILAPSGYRSSVTDSLWRHLSLIVHAAGTDYRRACPYLVYNTADLRQPAPVALSMIALPAALFAAVIA
jgi:hypothetical protein